MCDLTAEETIYLHRMMWYSMAKSIRKYKHVINVDGYKHLWISAHFDKNVYCDCFLCEYSYNKAFEKPGRNICAHCLLNWHNKDMREFYHCEKTQDKANWLKCTKCNDWREQADIAQAIAGLPIKRLDEWIKEHCIRRTYRKEFL